MFSVFTSLYFRYVKLNNFYILILVHDISKTVTWKRGTCWWPTTNKAHLFAAAASHKFPSRVSVRN